MFETEDEKAQDTIFSIGNTISKLRRSLEQNGNANGEPCTSAVILDRPIIGEDAGEDSPVDLDDFSLYSSTENAGIELSDGLGDNSALSEDTISVEPSVADKAKNSASSVRSAAAIDTSNSNESGKPAYSCNHCDYSATTYSGWNGHFKRRHSRLAQNCSSFKNHYSKVSVSQNGKIPTLYSCQHCNYITLSMAGFIIHCSKVHPKRKANPLKQGSPITTDTNRKYLEALYLSRDESPRTKNKVRQLLEKFHQDSRVLEEVPRFLSLKCILCKQNCPTAGVLAQHYKMCHSAEGPKKNGETGLYHCKICQHEALTRSALYKHYINNHLMDAYYAWSIPDLQEKLREKDRLQPNGSVSIDMLEKPNLPLSWNEDSATEQHFAGDNIPCICCEFSTQNVIELLSHYQNAHDGFYPNGFEVFMLERLILHVKPVYIPECEVNTIDEISGAWVNETGQLIQYYEYNCRLCDFTNEWFDAVLNHFTKDHPAENCSVSDATRKIATLSVKDARPEKFSQCLICGFILMDPAEDEMLRHCESKHGGPGVVEKFTTHSLTERRCCRECDYAGNIDAMQWHCANLHDCYIFLWHTLKLDEAFMSVKEFMCHACDFSSKTDWELASHYQEHHFGQVVTFCAEEINDQMQFKCLFCNNVTDSLTEVITHNQQCFCSVTVSTNYYDNHIRYLSCSHCKKVFSTSTVLWTHIVQNHCSFAQLFQVDDLPDYTLKDGYWNPSFTPRVENGKGQIAESRMFRSVRRARNAEYDDDDDDIGIPKKIPRVKKNSPSVSGGSVSSGSITTPHTLKCKFCSFSATIRGTLTRHLRSIHRHGATLRCFGCEKWFSVITDCLQHHLHVHGLEISSETTYNFLLSDIALIQQGSSKYLCSWCGFKGLSRLAVANHISHTHIKGHSGRKKSRNSGPYSCQWCDYYTKNATSMRAHLSSKHERTVSYHSLTNFRSLGTDTGKSSDSSDEDYSPSKRKPQTQKSRKKPCHMLSTQCRISEDDDCLLLESLKTTHIRFKHEAKQPYTCGFCMKAFICATTFLKHCTEEHSEWCSISFVSPHVMIVPDAEEIPDLKEHLELERYAAKSRDQEISIFREADWPCDLCGSSHLTLVELQRHVCEAHTGRKLLICRYCDFVSLAEKKIVAHSHLHVRMREGHTQPPPESLFNERDINEQDLMNDEDVIDLVTMESNSAESLQPIVIDPEPFEDVECETISYKANQEVRDHVDKIQAKIPVQKARKSIRGNVRNSPVFAQQSSIGVDEETSSNSRKVPIPPCDDEVIVESGLISCSQCEFSCTDAQRMLTHVKSNHTQVKSYSCKFCDYSSDQFSNLDIHLAEFHKIAKNHQLGLQVCSMRKKGYNSNAFSESRSRFLYTPTPSLPILREEVVYIEDNQVCDFTGSSTSSSVRNVENIEELKCSYCGFEAKSTFILEMHMRRHESAFDEDSSGGMNYRMTKMHMTSFS